MMIELLKASIQEALPDYASSLTVPTIHDPELNGYLNQLATLVEHRSNEIFANISTVLDTLDELATPLPPPAFDFTHRNEFLLDNNEMMASPWIQVDGAFWMHEVASEVAAIEDWEENVNTLSLLVISDFDARRITVGATEDTDADAMVEVNNEWNSNEENLDLDDSLGSDHLYTDINRIPNDVSLDIIKKTPLKSYLLRRDNQRNVIISEKERKTRRHIGVIDAGTLFQNVTANGKVDPTAVFSYNIGAVSQLAVLYETISAKLRESSMFLHQDDKLSAKLRQLKNSFRNPKQLALDVAVLNSEEGLTRIELMKQQMLHSVNTNLTLSRQSYMEISHASKEESMERLHVVENEYQVEREGHLDHVDASLDAILAYIAALDDMKSIFNSTSRDLLHMLEESAIESNVAKEVILAEAEIERENEAVSINQIKVLGTAHIEETKEFIQNVFWKLATCFHHVVSTSTGREQFVFYVGVAASLVLALSTIKEIISLTCSVLLKLFITPRLVREYGNLRFRMSLSRKAKIKLDSIFLPTSIKERIEQATKTASFAQKRRLPLRNILLHGNPGCGKSVTAKAIAQSIPNLPYALMSGADIAPLATCIALLSLLQGNQGPSELRRLLSWANKYGGVIIIDEAESALGKRGKIASIHDDAQQQHQQQDFSRDCLNVLLSLTGTMGNIMLILTTTNPGELDEAVLDRMDEIIHLPSLASSERTDLLQHNFSRLFELEPKQPTSFIHRTQLSIRQPSIKARYDNNNFDVIRSISELANLTDLKSFSGREMEKLLQGMAYKVYASDAGVLSQSLWDRETKKLVATFTAKHKGRSIETNGRLHRTFKHEIESGKAQRRQKIKYIPNDATEEDDENSLGYNDYLLGKHAKKASAPSRKIRTRSSSKRSRTPLEDITPMVPY